MSDGGFSRVLDESLAARCQTEDPVVCAFFRPPRAGEKPRRAVSTERWVTAVLDIDAELSDVQETAQIVTEELVTTPINLMREILLSEPQFLPELPKWGDGEGLHSVADQLRFGVLGGNLDLSIGNAVSDLKRAYVRLLTMNMRDPFDPEEVVRVICPVSRVEEFEKAHNCVPFDYEVLGLSSLTICDPWFVVRRPVAVIKMEKPVTNPPVSGGSLLRLGVRYTIWLDNPASVVCKMRPELAHAKL